MATPGANDNSEENRIIRLEAELNVIKLELRQLQSHFESEHGNERTDGNTTRHIKNLNDRLKVLEVIVHGEPGEFGAATRIAILWYGIRFVVGTNVGQIAWMVYQFFSKN